MKRFLLLLLVSAVGLTVSYLGSTNQIFMGDWHKWKTAKPTDFYQPPYHMKSEVEKYKFIASAFANRPRNQSLKKQSNHTTHKKLSYKRLFLPTVRPNTHKVLNYSVVLHHLDCELWQNHPDKWKIESDPQIKLDPSKFMYPGLVWGPNNQIVGFWQSIFLAIRLNRTLVIPRFHAHRTTGGGTILASQRIDVERLRRFVTTISIEQFSEICNHSFDVVLQAQASKLTNFKVFENDTGMAILHIEKKRIVNENGATQLRFKDTEENINFSNIPAFPPESYQLTYEPWITGKIDALRKAYNTSARCALYSSPFGTIRIQDRNTIAKPLTENVLHHLDVYDKELFSAVLDSVRRPVAIVNAVEQFKAKMFDNEPYVAVHWRYDLNDWKHHHCRPNHPERYSQYCRDLPKIIPEDVANGIFTSLNDAKINQSAWKHVYIASPPALLEFADKVFGALQKLNRNVKSSIGSLKAFLTDRYQPCWKQEKWSNEKEIFSLAEMEILQQSEWFFFSSGSTFSSNVRPMRWAKTPTGEVVTKFERSIYVVAKNAMKRRGG